MSYTFVATNYYGAMAMRFERGAVDFSSAYQANTGTFRIFFTKIYHVSRYLTCYKNLQIFRCSNNWLILFISAPMQLHLIVIRDGRIYDFQVTVFLHPSHPPCGRTWHLSTLYRSGYWHLSKITRQHLECLRF